MVGVPFLISDEQTWQICRRLQLLFVVISSCIGPSCRHSAQVVHSISLVQDQLLIQEQCLCWSVTRDVMGEQSEQRTKYNV